jgi:hypothetical protein
MMKVQKYRSAADSAHIGVRAYPDSGERVPVIGSYSEVMIHCGLAGKPIEVSLVRNVYLNGQLVPDGEGRQYVARVWKDGRPFSAPILTSEAGFYEDELGYYCYPDVKRLSPSIKLALMRELSYPTAIEEVASSWHGIRSLVLAWRGNAKALASAIGAGQSAGAYSSTCSEVTAIAVQRTGTA